MTTLAVPGLDRKTPDNHYKYTEDQLTEKKLALKQMKELWPLSNDYYNEMVYDLCKNSTPDEMLAIKKKIDTTPFKYA